MGMFDDVVLHDKTLQEFKCAAGHMAAVGTRLQSKSMQDDPGLSTFHVFNGKLFVEHRSEPSRKQYELRDNQLLVHETYTAEPVPRTFSAVVYGHCTECDPVCFVSATGLRHDMIQHVFPWVEYMLRFVDGLLDDMSPSNVETRDAVAKRIAVGLLPDTDTLVQRHLQLLREKPGRIDW